MGCGSSGNAVAVHEESSNGVTKTSNGAGLNGAAHHQDDGDDIPTVVLPDTPVKPKPPVAFEIPLEEFDGSKRPGTPPVHLQRLMQPSQTDISLPDIKGKLAEAEQRRQSVRILQARAASAQKRVQKMTRTMHGMDRLESDHEVPDTKHVMNTLTIPPEPGVCEDKNI